MKRAIFLSLSLVALLFSTACGEEEETINARDLTAGEQALVKAGNAFGFEFFNEVITQSDGDNVFVSPLSVSMALGMTYNGARTTTAEGMREALVYGDLSDTEIKESYQSLIELLVGMDPKVTMEIANSIWVRDDVELLAAFIADNETYFDAVVTALDFALPGAVDTINAWVAQQTHDKIEEIVDGPINPSTVMFLINAIYFKGDWAQQFDADQTATEDFHLANGSTKPVQMMHLTGDLPYVVGDNFRAVDLGYGAGLFRMMVILPDDGVDVDEVAASLTAENWDAWQQSAYETEVALSLPRFELEYEQTLNDVLIALGMDEAFSAAADFSGMNGIGGLYISEVKHKTFVHVDEEGTEAAAVTSVEMRELSAGPGEQLRVDRPFLFVIHDLNSSALMFMGKIANP